MKLYINTKNGKRVAKILLTNEFGEITKSFVGVLSTRKRNNKNEDTFEFCELVPERKKKLNDK